MRKIRKLCDEWDSVGEVKERLLHQPFPPFAVYATVRNEQLGEVGEVADQCGYDTLRCAERGTIWTTVYLQRREEGADP